MNIDNQSERLRSLLLSPELGQTIAGAACAFDTAKQDIHPENFFRYKLCAVKLGEAIRRALQPGTQHAEDLTEIRLRAEDCAAICSTVASMANSATLASHSQSFGRFAEAIQKEIDRKLGHRGAHER